MDIKSKVKDDIMLKMKNHVDAVVLDILGSVLVQVLSGVEVVQKETLPATVDDTNTYLIDLFKLKKAPKLSERTAKYYLESITRLIDHVQKPLTLMTAMDIESFLMSLAQDNNAVSINNNRRNISAFFTWLRKSHIVVVNPCDAIEPYTEVKKPIDHLEPEEVEQLKEGCSHKRDRALLEFLRSTAVRVGEAVSVKVSDIDWRTGEIKVYGSKGRAYRSVWLDSVALQYVSDYVLSRGIMLNSHEPLFVAVKDTKYTGMTSGGIRSALVAIKKRANMERRVYPHLLRKTTASNIIKRGGSVHDAGEYLGHKESSTAGKYYAFIGKDHTYNIFRQHVAAI